MTNPIPESFTVTCNNNLALNETRTEVTFPLYGITIAYNDGTPYTATTTGLNIELKAGATKNAVVRVEYLQPDSSSDLPQQAVTVEVSGSLKYDQVESGS